jgi:hypothetical protein
VKQREHRPQRRQRSLARVVLALLLLAMAAGQLTDFPGFVDVLRDYDIGAASAAWIAAIGLVAGEATGGVLLLSGSTSVRRSGAVVALAVAIAWSALALTAFARGIAIDNCGCFGVYLAQPLRWWVLLEDAEFIALGAWVLIAERTVAALGRTRSRIGFRTRTVEGATDVRAPQAP